MSDIYGYSVSVSGNTLAVGAIGDDDLGSLSGSVYVFTRSGAAWTLQQKLKAADGSTGDRFGQAVSVDGDTLVVGANYDSDQGTASGSAYVFVRTGTTWSQEAKLLASNGTSSAQFGYAVSVDGDTAAVGAPHRATFNGGAYVFVRSGTTWTQQTYFAGQAGSAEWLGSAVSLSGDTLIAGAHHHYTILPFDGLSYVYVRSGTTWSQQDVLSDPTPTSGGNFGWVVSLDGDQALIGQSNFSANVFVRTGTAWSLQAELLPGESADRFGTAVALDGERAVVGAHDDDDQGADAGAAFVFARDGTTWSLAGKLVAADAAAMDSFAQAVDLEGDTIVIGAPVGNGLAADTGTAYVFEVLPEPSVYWSGKTNACGVGFVSATGAPSASSSSGFSVVGASPLGGRVGVLLYNEGAGPAPPYLPFGGTGDGRLCVRILGMTHARGAASGGVPGLCGNGAEFAVDMNAYAAGALGGFPAAYLSAVGATVHCQWWGRESPGSSYMSGCLQYTVGP